MASSRAYRAQARSAGAETTGTKGTSRTYTRRSKSKKSSRNDSQSIFGVPARFMRPRLILIAMTIVLVCFGLLMIYSASSITAMEDYGDSAYYLKRQAIFAAVGAVVAIVLANVDYHVWCDKLLGVIWVLTLALLILVLATGETTNGATRWISIGSFQIQPSEFAKLTIVATAANLFDRWIEKQSISDAQFLMMFLVGVGVPLILILFQPDKGTTMVIGLTLVVMAYLAGVDGRIVFLILVAAIVAFGVYSLADDYSRERLLVMLDPWSDPYDSGYQLIQGFYAFGSGGIFGVGLGYSRQKYSYLPMAYNDFIFAVIGEELGLVGTLLVVVAFGVFAWAGYEIARRASDIAGRVVAGGCTTLIVSQFLLNVAGVIGIFPLSGKPIPFLSYGGSSILGSLMIVGVIVSVSVHSSLAETEHDRARRSLSLEQEGSNAANFTVVSNSTARSSRRSFEGSSRRSSSVSSSSSSSNLTVVEGGSDQQGSSSRRSSDSSRGRSSGSSSSSSGSYGYDDDDDGPRWG